MRRKYAQGTTVPMDRSRALVEKLITREGAERFAIGWEPGRVVITFEMRDRRVRFDMPMPAKEAEKRRRWRALILLLKAKFEAVASEITTFETEFLAHIVLPGGATVGGWAEDQLAEIYNGGKIQPLLGMGS